MDEPDSSGQRGGPVIYRTIAVAAQTDRTANALMHDMGASLDRILAQDLKGFAKTGALPTTVFSDWADALSYYDNYIDHILQAEQWDIRCRQGCSACCQHELARGVGSMEVLAIYRYVHDWPDIDDLYRHSVENAAAFQALLKKQVQADPRPLIADDERVLTAHLQYNRQQRPCPFLDNISGSCRIYPVRPLVCRFFFNLSDPAHCAPNHPAYLERNTRCIDPHQSIKFKTDTINRHLGIRMLSFLSGAFATLAADVMEGSPIRLT